MTKANVPLLAGGFGQLHRASGQAIPMIVPAMKQKALHERAGQAKGDAPGFAGFRAGP
ncbi:MULTISPECIES: hypothetical protein [unclassified Sphingomonas]|uniref:hypothetical protein n=1 Tax=unclassified Sphingomonas TaxID=196159 RepID=UPI001D1206FC|nr:MULTISPECIES: hypothetical protein [unclassified Sphingomonas]MCC2979886.1 hypothetical protein [Sphingomonas sp. IC4-52]MCD2314647.1 hypothetical protein [Sphingomonas sp. IC-11]